ncbi:MAG: ABC transporter permease [Desulfitobacterium sp.]|nr:ABC transporter permease [Desulfitobacterium sp.]
MGLNSARYVLREVGSSLRRNIWLSIASVLTIMIAMVILGASLFFFLNAANLAENFESELEINVFTQEDLSNMEVSALGERLKGLDGVQSIELITKEQALAKFAQEYSESLVEDLGGENPFPDSYKVFVTEPELVEGVAKKIDSLTGVDNVVYGKEVIGPLLQFTNWLRWVGMGVVAIFAVASIVLISLNIRMTVYSRRKEIEIMKLVGASNSFIRWPFLLEGMVVGLVGGLFATLIVGMGYDWFAQYIQSTLTFVPVVSESNLIWKVLALLVLIGMGIGALGSIISLRRFLKV